MSQKIKDEQNYKWTQKKHVETVSQSASQQAMTGLLVVATAAFGNHPSLLYINTILLYYTKSNKMYECLYIYSYIYIETEQTQYTIYSISYRYICTFVHTHIPTKPSNQQTNQPTNQPTFLPTYLPTYPHLIVWLASIHTQNYWLVLSCIPINVILSIYTFAHTITTLFSLYMQHNILYSILFCLALLFPQRYKTL